MKNKLISPGWYQTLEFLGMISFPILLFYIIFTQINRWQSLSIIEISLALIGVWIFADLLSGFIHWGADTYGNEKTPILGKGLIHPFREHHEIPNKMTTYSFLYTNGSLYFGGTIILLTSYFFTSNILNLSVIFLSFWVSQTNQIHKWAHLNKNKRGWKIRALYKTKLIINPETHQKHHDGKFNTSYCITSGICNPILDRINFWRKLENFISRLNYLK